MKKWSIFYLSFAYIISCIAQNRLTLSQCESLFLKNNLYLLAEQCNIEKSQAAVIQAKIWDQPILSGELNALNPDNKRYLDIGNAGQKAFAINQLFLLGGKRKKEVDFVKSNAALATLQYEQLLRSLRSTLKQSFYSIYFNQNKIKSIQNKLTQLDTFIYYYNIQVDKGNIPLKDLVRLQTLSISFKNDLLNAQESILEDQEKLKILTNTSIGIIAELDSTFIMGVINKTKMLNENELFQKAIEKNIDYQIAKKVTASNELQLKWQKSLEVPDINIGAAYDQKGGAFNNQVNLTFALPLPLWKKNSGNIKIIKAEINQNKFQESAKLNEIQSSISTAAQTITLHQTQYVQAINALKDFNVVYKGVLDNFTKRNISMIEFTDFMESYNQSILYINDVEKRLIDNCIQLNLLTNEEIFAL